LILKNAFLFLGWKKKNRNYFFATSFPTDLVAKLWERTLLKNKKNGFLAFFPISALWWGHFFNL